MPKKEGGKIERNILYFNYKGNRAFPLSDAIAAVPAAEALSGRKNAKP
jgi:hypothetical protein